MIVELKKVPLGDGMSPRVDVRIGGKFVGGMYETEAKRLLAAVVAHDHEEALAEDHDRSEAWKLAKPTP